MLLNRNLLQNHLLAAFPSRRAGKKKSKHSIAVSKSMAQKHCGAENGRDYYTIHNNRKENSHTNSRKCTRCVCMCLCVWCKRNRNRIFIVIVCLTRFEGGSAQYIPIKRVE